MLSEDEEVGSWQLAVGSWQWEVGSWQVKIEGVEGFGVPTAYCGLQTGLGEWVRFVNFIKPPQIVKLLHCVIN